MKRIVVVRALSRDRVGSRARAVRSVGESVLERLIRRAKIGYRSGASRRDNPVAATIERTLFAEGIGQRLSTYVFCRTPCWVLNVPRASLRNSLFRRVSPVAEREREREEDREGSAKSRRPTASRAKRNARLTVIRVAIPRHGKSGGANKKTASGRDSPREINCTGSVLVYYIPLR